MQEYEYKINIYTSNKINNSYITCSYNRFKKSNMLLNILVFDGIYCMKIVNYDKIMKYDRKL